MKLQLILTIFMFSTLQSIEIDRELRQETLHCRHGLECPLLDAETINSTECLCREGTFYIKDNAMKCLKGSGEFAGCSTYFEYYSDTIQTIHVVKFPASEFNSVDEFSYSLVTGQSCTDMDIASVKIFNNKMEWVAMDNDFKIVYASVVNAYYLRWKNPENVPALNYVGYLLKFNLNCRKENGVTVKTCVLGKIVGHQLYNADKFEFCKAPVTTTSTITTKPETTKPSTDITSKSKSTQSPQSQTKDDNSQTAVIVAIACSIVFIVFLCVLGICLWYKKRANCIASQKSDDLTSEVMLEGEDIYALPTEPHDVENPSYLMQLKGTRPQKRDVKSNYNYANAYENMSSKQKKSIEEPIQDNYSNNVTPYTPNLYETLEESKNLINSQAPSHLENRQQIDYVQMESNENVGNNEYEKMYCS